MTHARSEESTHSRRRAVGLGAGLLLLTLGCQPAQDARPVEPKLAAPRARPVSKARPPHVSFVDITARAGIHFHHTSGALGKKLLPETLGSGCAFLDFDGDGHQDILLLNARPWPGFTKDPLPTMALYRNRGDGTFVDVTEAVGLAVPLFGMGVAVGDYDNDGYPDLFITAVGGNRLFRSAPGAGPSRRFVDATPQAGDLKKASSWPAVEGQAFLDWSTPVSLPSSSAFLDYDKDGLLDLVVCNYVEWSPRHDLTQGFTYLGLGRAYGPPRTFEGTSCQLYRNRGDGSFEDVTRKAGIEVLGELGKPVAKALGVIVCDVDDDGWPDIVVANDTVRNFFFHNRGNGSFVEKGLEAGVAYADGSPRGAMGIDWGEYRKGECGLMIGNFANEPNTFLRLDDPRRPLFSDVALMEGVAGPSRQALRFGLFFFDFDLDGRLDFLSCNGHLEPEIHKVEPNQTYKQAPQLYWNTGERPAFELLKADAIGPDLLQPLVGRGCAYADIDGNGTLDVLLTENGGPARLLRNDGVKDHHWVRLVLEGDGKTCNRSAIGTQVILTADGQTQRREVTATKGYLSCSELPVTFGLGKTTKIDRVEIRWPAKDAAVQVLTDVVVDRSRRVQYRPSGER